MTLPSISIVVPTFQRPEMLFEALESIAQQTLLPENLDVFVSDDASGEATSQVIEKFRQLYPKISLRFHQHKKNIGGPLNWKFCLENAKGEFVFLLSDDDAIEKKFIEEYVAVLRANPNVDIIFSDQFFCDDKLQKIEIAKISQRSGMSDGILRLRDALDAHHMVMTSMYRKSLLLEAGGWDARYAVHLDIAGFSKTALLAKEVFYISKPLFRYRIAAGSWTGFRVDKQTINFLGFRALLDDLVSSTTNTQNDLRIFLARQYSHHARIVMSGLEVKLALGKIKRSDLHATLTALFSVFPEAKNSRFAWKLWLSGFSGVGWLRIYRKLLGKQDPYSRGLAIFERN